MVVFNIDHPDIIQLRDGSPGFIWCKSAEEKKARALKAAGFDMSVDSGIDAYSIQYQNANNSIRVTDEFMQAYLEGRDWHTRAVTTGDVINTYEARDVMKQIAQAAWECADPGMQYHSTVNDWHTAPAAGPITASNPCSEYMHIDNSPCNLASINLLKFLREDATFDTHAFEHTVFTVLLGQAILCVAADYPTDKIGENARGFRQLGIGYANLGALLMALGVAYDSDQGRAWAGAITSLMQGASYRASARFAEIVGPYPGTDELPGFSHPENREATLRVLKKHATFTKVLTQRPGAEDRKLDRRVDVFHTEVIGAGRPAQTDAELARVTAHANQVWDEAIELAERFGVENSQVSVLAPTGTIGFMMDCDTTGVEPDLALKKVKKMVGGGTMSIINQTIPRALRRLGYIEEQVEAIEAYIDENNTVVGAPALRPEHYDVFACSFTTDNLIGHMGHVKMMAAVQPFLSGAISKTVNVPETAGVEDMEEIFVEGWRLGLKAVAMYRDNCKADQPLSAEQNKVVEETVGETPAHAVRKRLPRIRDSRTYSFRVADTEGYVHVGMYPDSGQPGEMFIKVAKQGSTLAGVMGAFALSVSMGLQHGVPLETFVEKFVNDTFEPHGITDDPDIRFAKSLMDYIFRRLALDFLPKAKREALGIRSVQERTELLDGAANGNGMNIIESSPAASTVPSTEVGSTADLVPALDAPLCANCGTRMRPAGSCFACESCGSTSGCS
jgi:ribonucleoside-diphosphate reductase alpha chain